MEAGKETSQEMVERQVEVKNADGLHMRPAMQFVDAAGRFTSAIKVSNTETTADGKSIMQMSMLAATEGTKLTLRAEGPDALEAIELLSKLLEVRMPDENDSRQAGEEQDLKSE